ncbi:glycoside hydrolase family 3 C-terminal domain-containing protein [Kutzneria sp. NPDC051319]|uniref:glycoside hydrolase family 3 C-terminal domain-containing protein n=1 Tax=Kutzneria sp. NPDC051319 TaxID=3155047 RepID=UPI003413C088
MHSARQLHDDLSVDRHRVDLELARLSLQGKIALLGQTQPAAERLGLPAAEFTVHPLTEDVSTSFPVPLGLGSSWNPQLALQVGAAVADEIRAAGAGLIREMPVAVPIEDPRLGRNEHRYAEDPLLCAKLSALHTVGLRGPDAGRLRVAPVLWWGETADTNPRESFNLRLIHEHQLTIYRACFELGGPAGAVLALERFGAAPGTATFLIREIIRAWSDEDTVVWFETQSPPARGAATEAMRMDADGFLGPWDVDRELVTARLVGAVAEQRITLAARRILALRSRLARPEGPAARFDRRAHRSLARQAARESIVLLRNDGLLPLLTSAGLRVAVVGPHCGELAEELGKRVVDVQHDNGADRVRLIVAETGVRLDFEFDMIEWRPGHYELRASSLRMAAERQPDGTLLAGKPTVGVYLTVDNADHTISTTTDRSRATPLHWVTLVDGATRGAELARNADVVVLAVGDEPTAEDSRGDVRSTLNLPAQQQRLVREVRAANANSALTVFSTHPYALDWEDNHLPAILWTVPGGLPARSAMTEVLLGEKPPAGRLPQTWYRSDADVTAELDRDTIAGQWTYMYTHRKPLYPFGHGLTYTTFAYGPLRLSGSHLRDDGELAISILVRNTGFRECAEVVQLYTRQLDSAVTQPNKQLRDFQKIVVPPQSSRTVTFRLRASDLAFWDVLTHSWTVESGTHEISVGRSSEDLVATAAITVHGRIVRGRTLADGALRASSAEVSAGIAIVETDVDMCPVISPTRPEAWLGFLRCSTAGARAWGVTASNPGDRPVTIRLHADAHDGPVLSMLTIPPTANGESTALAADLPTLPDRCDLYVVFARAGLRLTTLTFAAA